MGKIDEIKKLCLTEERVPFEFRKDGVSVKEFINTIKSNNILVTNPNVEQIIKIYETKNETFSIINNISYIGIKETMDLEVENNHSYVANGIVAHNTVNLPNSTTEEEVSNIYIESWKRGLKGVTVYRDGCRSGVIVAVDKKEEPKKDTSMICMEDGTAKRRPKTLEAKIIRFNNKGDKWVGVIGMLDGKPYELFTGMLEKLNIPSWVETGVIIKNYEEIEVDGEIKKKSRYDLCYNDKDGYRVCVEGISRTFNPEFWNYAKLISGLLRHHMPIPYIIKVISTLKMDDSTINTWKNGVVRVLRKFESSVADEIEGEKCPECGGRLVRENGCIHCIDCGYSKCG